MSHALLFKVNRFCWWSSRQLLCLAVRLPYERRWSKPRKALRWLEDIAWKIGYRAMQKSIGGMRHV